MIPPTEPRMYDYDYPITIPIKPIETYAYDYPIIPLPSLFNHINPY